MNNKITAEQLHKRYKTEKHIENGNFIEKHYESNEEGRPSSGSIYYYLAPNIKSEFHKIDCDEYWCYIKGESLEIWIIDKKGKIIIKKFGIDEGCEPMIYFPKGVIFGSKSLSISNEGTFLSCITVPRFTYDGFTLFKQKEMEEIYPETKEFYK